MYKYNKHMLSLYSSLVASIQESPSYCLQLSVGDKMNVYGTLVNAWALSIFPPQEVSRYLLVPHDLINRLVHSARNASSLGWVA
jgi:hypothetical protein